MMNGTTSRIYTTHEIRERAAELRVITFGITSGLASDPRELRGCRSFHWLIPFLCTNVSVALGPQGERRCLADAKKCALSQEKVLRQL